VVRPFSAAFRIHVDAPWLLVPRNGSNTVGITSLLRTRISRRDGYNVPSSRNGRHCGLRLGRRLLLPAANCPWPVSKAHAHDPTIPKDHGHTMGTSPGTFHGGAFGILSHPTGRVDPVVRNVALIRPSQSYESSSSHPPARSVARN
jgi:hypothetical protein